MRDLTIDEVKTVAGAVDADQVEFMTTQQFKASLGGGGGGVSSPSLPTTVRCCSGSIGPVEFEVDVFEAQGDLLDAGKTDPFDTKLGIQSEPE